MWTVIYYKSWSTFLMILFSNPITRTFRNLPIAFSTCILAFLLVSTSSFSSIFLIGTCINYQSWSQEISLNLQYLIMACMKSTELSLISINHTLLTKKQQQKTKKMVQYLTKSSYQKCALAWELMRRKKIKLLNKICMTPGIGTIVTQ